MKLSHLDAEGRPRMVDVGAKPTTARRAVAEGVIAMSAEAFELVRGNSGPKGNVVATAELAGTMGAKRTADLVPLCHPLTLDHVDVRATLEPALPGIRIRATVRATQRTGVEMEALTAVMVALLTVYDMVKAVGHDLRIGDVVLLEKAGGTKKDWKKE